MFPWQLIIVEEFQDLTPLFLEVLKLVLANACHHRRRNAPYPRILALGDMNQNITYFQGSYLHATTAIISAYSVMKLTMRLTKRLSKAVAGAANDLLQAHLQVFTSGDGQVELLKTSPDALDGFYIESGATMASVLYLIHNTSVFFLFRTNREVFAFTLALIARGFDCATFVSGEITSARGMLMSELNKMAGKCDSLEQISNYIRLRANRKRGKELRSCLEVLIAELVEAGHDAHAKNGWFHVKNKIFVCYSADPLWTLCTIHQSKGRETTVALLVNLLSTTPSTHAQRLGGVWLDQEYKLLYVALTRARIGVANMVGLDDMIWPPTEDDLDETGGAARKRPRLQNVITELHTRSAESSQDSEATYAATTDFTEALATLSLASLPPNLSALHTAVTVATTAARDNATQFRRVQAAAIELRTLLAFGPQPTPAVLAPPPTPPPRLPSADPGSSSSTGTAVATSRARAMLHELQFPELTEQPALPEVAQLAHDE